MEKGWLKIVLCFFLLVGASAIRIPADRSIPQRKQQSPPPLKLRLYHNHVEMDNGIVKLTLSRSGGLITGVQYKGIDNLLEWRNKETQRGYWDIMWSRPDTGRNHFDTLQTSDFRVILETVDQIEVSFTTTWNESPNENTLPLNIDKRFILRRGDSGFYSYAIFEHPEGWPDLNVDELRIAFKLENNLFHYMAVSDDIQKVMPTEHDRDGGKALDYKEAVLLTNPANPRLKGEVDDKYQFSFENKDDRVHGWISTRANVGFWVINPSDEFRVGGPIKPDLTAHAGSTCLAVMVSGHYSGFDFGIRLRNGQYWKKVFGPVYIYLNSGSGTGPNELWQDAKRQMSAETAKWPYDFPSSKDFPRANQRGSITGRLVVRDRYISSDLIPAKSAYVGLALPGDVGSWQVDAMGYQFWTQTNETGHFTIQNVRADRYNLYAFVPGIMGDFKHNADIVIQPGNEIQIGDLVFDPPRTGPTLWEIGVPDRTAAEFFIPDPPPGRMTKLYVRHTDNPEKFRQYGLWDRYTDLYPTQDLVYTVGTSDYRKDWFFAHVNRKVGQNYEPTTWKIVFDATNVERTGTYTLRIALAAANFGEVQVRINDQYARRAHFRTGRIGRDNAIARHWKHGRYWLYSVEVPGYLLNNGRNTIYLGMPRGGSPFNGVMYDYLRLEGPAQL